MISRHFHFPALSSLVIAVALAGCMTTSRQQSAQVAEVVGSLCRRACGAVRASALLGETRSGSFGEGIANAQVAYDNCMAGSPVTSAPSPRTMGYTQGFHGAIICTEI
jgi:hypothetical protein